MAEAPLVKRAKKLAKKYGFKIVDTISGSKIQESEGNTVLWYTRKSSDDTERLTLNWMVWGTKEILSFYRELVPGVSWERNGNSIRWKTRGMEQSEMCLYIDNPEFIWKTNALTGSTP